MILTRLFTAFVVVCTLACGAFTAGAQQTPASRDAVPYMQNIFWTTDYGPAYANISLKNDTILACKGGPFALCAYSGPAGSQTAGEPALPRVIKDGVIKDGVAHCRCFKIESSEYFVNINAIINTEVYVETIRACGVDGSACKAVNSAPVCGYINSPAANSVPLLVPGADLISTFSQVLKDTIPLGSGNCPTAPYAGCMSAPCYVDNGTTGDKPTVRCECPIFNGPYQITQTNGTCSLGGDNIWSAVYYPSKAK